MVRLPTDILLADSLVSIRRSEKLSVPSSVYLGVPTVEVHIVVNNMREDPQTVGTGVGTVVVAVRVVTIVPLLQDSAVNKVVRSRIGLNQKVSDSVGVVAVIRETM